MICSSRPVYSVVNLNRHPQPNPIVGCVNQILFGAKVALGSLDGCVAQQHLNLFKLATGGAAQLRRGPATIVRRDARDPPSGGVGPEELPNHLLRQHVALHLIATIHGPENKSVHHAGGSGPGIDGDLHPHWHRNGPNPSVLPVQIHDAPPSVALLYVPHRKCGDLGPPYGAAEQDGDDGAVAQSLGRRDVRRVQERLGLPECEPVSGTHPDGLRAFSRAGCQRPTPAPAARCRSPPPPACGWRTSAQ